MTIWTNRDSDSTTNWSLDSETSSTSWSLKDGTSTVFGTSPFPSTISGVFNSAAAAASSVLGGPYSLLDNAKFI